MRLATYTMSGAQHREPLTAVLQHMQAQIVCVVDAPPNRKLRRIARAAGLEIATSAGDKGRRTAVLADADARILSTGELVLPVEDRRMPNRTVAQAIIGIAGIRIAVAACQFGPQFDEREQHSNLVLDFLDKMAAPVVFGADFNTSPKGEIPQRFAAVYLDGWEAGAGGIGNTYPTPDPSTRRDMLFLGHEFDVTGAIVPADPPVDSASLHRPVIVDVAD